jgi:peptidoglycan hydrolase-like protein with peptidoglycan-binding domain
MRNRSLKVIAAGLAIAGVSTLLVDLLLVYRPNRSRTVPHLSIAAVLLESNSQFQFAGGVSRRGWSTIHFLDAETAVRVEEALHRVAKRTGLPVNYLAAHVMRESTGDPKAEFRNPARWDAASDERGRFEATDHGLVQISGRNLIDKLPALTLPELKAKAEDVDFATDFLADTVAGDLEWASRQDIDARDGVDRRVVAKAKNPYWLAALAYNRGRAGALSALSNPRACRHADLVNDAWSRIDARTARGSTAKVQAPSFPSEAEDDPRQSAMGDVGPGVEALQRLLIARLSPNPLLATDGEFGPATRDALIRFQRSRGLDATGVTDARVWDALLGPGSTNGAGSPRPFVMGEKSPRVAELQRLLNDRLARGPKLVTDGDFGPATRDALIRCQRSRAIAPTGAADAATWEALAPPAQVKSAR